jgi:hypothetical protein
LSAPWRGEDLTPILSPLLQPVVLFPSKTFAVEIVSRQVVLIQATSDRDAREYAKEMVSDIPGVECHIGAICPALPSF